MKASFFACVLITLMFHAPPADAQVNAAATEKTKILYNNLKIVQQSDQFLFGQEFFNSFRFGSGGAHDEETYSDSKTVTGSHPAVLGSDFHYYLEKSASERSYHTEAVKWAYQQGYVITFDWHISGRGTSSYEHQPETEDLVNNIVNNVNGDRDWLYEQFDQVIDIINKDLVVGDERIPIVFRPWHEMTGGWFWWGSAATNTTNYKELFKLTVEYFKARTNSVLFCWSPNSPVKNLNYYPGDDYVDVLGVDAYEVTSASIRADLAFLVGHAEANDKVVVFAETGNRTSDGNAAANYWRDTILPAIKDDPSGKSQRIAWVLTWINASWSFPYVPHSASSSAAKQSFTDFKNSPHVLFGDELTNMYVPMDPPVNAESTDAAGDDLQVFPVPSGDRITIRLKNFAFPVKLTLYDNQGRQLGEYTATKPEISIDSARFFKAGFSLIKASDASRTVSKRIVFE